MTNEKFTHLKEDGVHMVEVGKKPIQTRKAIAKGEIYLQNKTIEMIINDKIKKGNVLTTAQVAGIQAVKKTSDLIPLCHPLNVSGIELDFDVKESKIIAKCSVKLSGQTGVEMEAITGVSVALLTIWDMVKSVEKDDDGQYPNTKISNIEVVKKEKI
ncbi:cyclic pyranopterin monophosphate synthase MoaC [Methanobrevibacter sp. OttesenSCG-928-K11]|nr:cyclic pyranopterin monophosphate synthase MoaC [Methanobrevibacter sp. OttesenSCG-928-K11]MDL2270468.1 cyclic pyranopterin monophosphate synthase MoaC [Methanobrevibacter sp. OttesenSCG-928-I08]